MPRQQTGTAQAAVSQTIIIATSDRLIPNKSTSGSLVSCGLVGNLHGIGSGGPMTDPVCGMDVNEKSAAAKSEYKGQTYYFCSMQCKQQFDKNPQTYAKQ